VGSIKALTEEAIHARYFLGGYCMLSFSILHADEAYFSLENNGPAEAVILVHWCVEKALPQTKQNYND
jgi:hypothetical protein